MVGGARCGVVRGRDCAAPLESSDTTILGEGISCFLTVNPQIFMDTIPYFVVLADLSLAGSSGSYRQPPSIINT